MSLCDQILIEKNEFVHNVPADEARRLQVLVHLPQGQIPDSHWEAESERCSQRSGNGREHDHNVHFE